MQIDKVFLERLLAEAEKSERRRVNYDLRNSAEDTSQRMLNALLPDTEVPIHRHVDTAETVFCLQGRLEEVFYEEVETYTQESGLQQGDVLRQRSFREIARYVLCPKDGLHGMQIPIGTWHTVHVLEPSVIFEAKDGKYKG